MKRNTDFEETEPNSNKKVKLEGDDGLIEIRLLIDNYEASVVIGKGGANVKAIRTGSNAFVSILRNDFQSKERIMTLKGTVEYIAKAAELIAQLLIDAANEKSETAETVTTATMKVLLHKACAGAIIGKGGEIIKEIQESTGGKLSLSTEPMGPSTEKTCSITGDTTQIYSAFTRVVTQLNENPPRAGTPSIPYVPGAAPQHGAAAYPPTGYGAPPGGAPAYGAPPSYGGPPPAGYYGAPPHSPYGAPPPGEAPKTEQIVIPTVCAGSVIGKGGSIIRDIKAQSSTNITIADPQTSAPGDRLVSITGAPSSVQYAISLIRHRVESYTPPPTGF